VHFDRRQEKLNYKIREAQLQKIPYMLIIGDQEAEKKLVSLRLRDGTNIQDLTREVLFAQIQKNLQSRSLHITLT
jgi:threonyl-tRNA synthetase